MRKRISTFLISMFVTLGVPFSVFSPAGSCTGSCGNCGFNCIPGVCMLLYLAFKFFAAKMGKNLKKAVRDAWRLTV